MIHVIENFLNVDELTVIKEIAKFETTGDRVCLDVPLYQSYSGIHIEYKDNLVVQKVIKKFCRSIYDTYNLSVKIEKLWFNSTRHESMYDWHKHPYNIPTALLYIDGCKGNGTIFKIGNAELQIIVDDNTFISFDGNQIIHKTPNFSGIERYTLAADFIEVIQ